MTKARNRKKSKSTAVAKRPLNTKMRSRDRNLLPPKLQDDENHPYANSIEIDDTVNDIIRDGKAPSDMTLERRFPGISTHPVARKEVMMTVIFQLRMRGYKNYQIAQWFGVEPQVISYYLREMGKQFENEIIGISFTGQVGRSVALFKELQGRAAKMIYDEKITSNKIKLRAISEVAKLELSVLNTLARAGFFSNARINPQHSKNAQKSDISDLHSLVMDVIEGRSGDDAIDAEITNPHDYEISDDDLSITRL